MLDTIWENIITYGPKMEDLFLEVIAGVSMVNLYTHSRSDNTGRFYTENWRTRFRFHPGVGITHIASYIFSGFSPVVQVFYQKYLGLGISVGVSE